MFWTIYKTRIILTIVALFIVSLAMSCQELRYMASGRTVDAENHGTRVEKEVRDGQTIQHQVLDYSFMDNDKYRREFIEMPMNWTPPAGETVKIQYLPGKERQSRLYGTTHMGWVALLFISIAGVAVWVFMAAREK